jgi:cardiolipin synthase
VSHLRAELPHELEKTGLNLQPGSADDGWRNPPPVVLADGSIAQLLKDGEALREAYRAIANARRLICLEVYIFGSDATGRAFADLLSNCAAEGVKVYVSYDSFGCMMTDRSMFQRMRQAGVRVQEFHPVRPWECRYSWRPANRDHRKLLIVDDEIAWLGGMNIGDEYAGPWVVGARALKVEPWRDTAIGIRGPAATELFRAFVKTWQYIQRSGRISRCEHIFEGQGFDVVGTAPAFRSKVRDRFRRAVHGARKSIQLTMAYFAPDDGMVEELCTAAKRGVRVQLMVPAKSDLPILTTAARSFYERMLKCGVEVFERQHVILHSKTLVVDSEYSVVGSTNLDYRSIEYNLELSVVIHSAEFGEKMSLLFENDIRYARKITMNEWRRRPVRDRIGQWAVSRARYLL